MKKAIPFVVVVAISLGAALGIAAASKSCALDDPDAAAKADSLQQAMSKDAGARELRRKTKLLRISNARRIEAADDAWNTGFWVSFMCLLMAGVGVVVWRMVRASKRGF